MYRTKSNAQLNPPSTAVQASCPAGGSPRNASMLVIPAALQPSNALWIWIVSMLVHVKCKFGFNPTSFLARRHKSKVSSDVLPPAPQVTSANSGFLFRNSFMTRINESTPASVLGGKNSMDTQGADEFCLITSERCRHTSVVVVPAASSPLVSVVFVVNSAMIRMWWLCTWQS